MSRNTAFILGATGYIGGDALVALVQKHPEFHYTALVRNPRDNKAVEALGVTVLQGSHSDLDIIEKAAIENDVVFNFADADDPPLTDTILRGLETRAKQGSAAKPILIHTRYERWHEIRQMVAEPRAQWYRCGHGWSFRTIQRHQNLRCKPPQLEGPLSWCAG